MLTNDPKTNLKIFLAVDSSEHSLAAIDLIRYLPLPHDATITVLAVLTIQHTTSRATLLGVLDYAQGRLQEKGLNANTGLLYGHPAQAICDFAEDHNPDLIVLGAKGLRATLGILLGGVAQQMVEYAHWPVLVVRLPYIQLNRVLLVTDGSSYSQKALEYFSNFPIKKETRLDVLNVLPPFPEPDKTSRPPKLMEESAPWQDEEECKGRDILFQSVSKLKLAGFESQSHLLRGDAATEIIKFADENQVDLIVAGSRGLSQVKGWLLGSVSRKLVHYSNCSVLIVKDHPEI